MTEPSPMTSPTELAEGLSEEGRRSLLRNHRSHGLDSQSLVPMELVVFKLVETDVSSFGAEYGEGALVDWQLTDLGRQVAEALKEKAP